MASSQQILNLEIDYKERLAELGYAQVLRCEFGPLLKAF